MQVKRSQSAKRSTAPAADAAAAAAPGAAALAVGPQPMSRKPKDHKWLTNSLQRAAERGTCSKSRPQKYMQVNDLSLVKPRGPPACEAAVREAAAVSVRPAPAAEAAAACTATGQGGPGPPRQRGNAAKPGEITTALQD
jgi:hypothetical protein